MSDTKSESLPPKIDLLVVLEKLEELRTQYDILETLNNKILSKNNAKGHPGEVGSMIFRCYYNQTHKFSQIVGFIGWLSPEEYTGMKFPSVEDFDLLLKETKELAVQTDEVIDFDPDDQEAMLKRKFNQVQSLHTCLITDSITKVTDKLEDIFGYVFY